MKIYYYYHIPKTGGTSILKFLQFLSNNVPNSKLYSFYIPNFKKDIPKNIDFNKILSTENILKYDYIFIHHHHGYHGLMHYENILIEKKKELKINGHTLKIFTTIRDVLSHSNSLLNYMKKLEINVDKSEFLGKDPKYTNIQSKYFFFCLNKNVISNEVINNKLAENNIKKISEVVDIFIETKNVSKLIDTMSKYFSLNYDSESRKNTNEHLIIFNDNAEQLLNNNKLDSFLLKTFGNNKNYENELKNFFSL